MQKLMVVVVVFSFMCFSFIFPVHAADRVNLGTLDVRYSDSAIKTLRDVATGKIPHLLFYDPYFIPSSSTPALILIINPSSPISREESSSGGRGFGFSVSMKCDTYFQFRFDKVLHQTEYPPQATWIYLYDDPPSKRPYIIGNKWFNANNFTFSFTYYAKTYTSNDFFKSFDSGYSLTLHNVKDGSEIVITDDPHVESIPSGLSVKTPPSKTEYLEGEALDLTGVTATVSMSDGTSFDVALPEFEEKGIVATPAHGSALKLTDTSVTLTLNEFTAQIPLTVKARPPDIASIAPKLPPTKTEYTEGDKLDLTGLSVTLTMDDNSTTDIPFADFPAHSIAVSPPHDSILTVDQKEITVSCKSFAFKIPIIVHEKIGPVEPPGPDEPNPDYVMFPECVRNEFLEYISGDIANIFNFSLMLFFMLLTVFLLAHIIKHYII